VQAERELAAAGLFFLAGLDCLTSGLGKALEGGGDLLLIDVFGVVGTAIRFKSHFGFLAALPATLSSNSKWPAGPLSPHAAIWQSAFAHRGSRSRIIRFRNNTAIRHATQRFATDKFGGDHSLTLHLP